MSASSDTLICMGKILAAHGLRGEVKVKAYNVDPTEIESYNPLLDASGKKQFHLNVRSLSGDVLIASIDGVEGRTAAEALKGKKLFVERALLPELEEDEFYYSDMIGLEVRTSDEQVMGQITAVQNYGAGDLLEVKLADSGKTELFPFKKEWVPEVRVREGYVVMNPPEFVSVKEETSQHEAKS